MLESIVNQTYKNLEIIIVNDGSTDKTSEICDQYAKKDDRIIVINQVNCGVVKARKAGVQIAKGKFITFVDADDYIELDMLLLVRTYKKEF